MKKSILSIITTALPLFLCGCGSTGEKNASLTILYAIAAVCSFVILTAYCFLIHKKDRWSSLLFVSVVIVNAGYFLLSAADSLSVALWALNLKFFTFTISFFVTQITKLISKLLSRPLSFVFGKEEIEYEAQL